MSQHRMVLAYRDEPLAASSAGVLAAECQFWSSKAILQGFRRPVTPVLGDPEREEQHDDDLLRQAVSNFDQWHRHVTAEAEKATGHATEAPGAGRTIAGEDLVKLRTAASMLAIERIAAKRAWAICAATDLAAHGMDSLDVRGETAIRAHIEAHATRYRQLRLAWAITNAELELAERTYAARMRRGQQAAPA
jgi:hypothetical protein